MSVSVEPSSIQISLSSKKTMKESPSFKQYHKSTEFINAVYYESKEPLCFITKVLSQKTDSHEINTEIKESKSQLYLFGFLPIGSIIHTRFVKEKVTQTFHFCDITPEMQAWIDSIKPYCQDVLRNRGKLNFRPTDEEVNLKTPIRVYPFIVEYGGMTGIGWKRCAVLEENLPV